MGRLPEEGLKYFPLSVGFFSDRRIRRLISEFGGNGALLYLYLIAEAYKSKGYYLVWDMDTQDAIVADLGVSEGFIKQVITYCVSRTLLIESTLADGVTVITSPGIQERFQEIKKTLKRDISVEREIWVLSEENTEPCIKFAKNENKSQKKRDKSGINCDKSEINPIKERKVKEKKIIETSASADSSFPEDSFEMKVTEKLIDSLKKSMPGAKVPETMEEKFKWCVHVERMKRLDGRGEQEIEDVLRFATHDPFWMANIRSTQKLREKFETLYCQSRTRRSGKFQDIENRGTDYNKLVEQQAFFRNMRE